MNSKKSLYDVLFQYLKGWAYNTDGQTVVAVKRGNVAYTKRFLAREGCPHIKVKSM